MTSKQFFKYLLEPEQMNDSTVVEMEQLIKQFPYFQTGHLMYLQALGHISSKLVKEKLPKESLYIADRARLYSILNGKKAEEAPQASAKAPKPAAPAQEKNTEDNSKAMAAAAVSAAIAAAANQPKEEQASNTEVTVKASEPQAETKAQTPAEETKAEAEVKTETKAEVKAETKTEVKVEVKTTAEKPQAENQLTNEERKINHERLVKDFFELNEIDKYETVATNVADDGSITAAAAEFVAKKNSIGTTPKETKKEETTTVETKTVEVKTEAPKAEEPKKEEPKPAEQPKENKDEIFAKIAALRKEQEEADKKRIQAEKEAMEIAAAAKAAVSAVSETAETAVSAVSEPAETATEVTTTTTTTTTTVVETVTTTVEKTVEEAAQETAKDNNEPEILDIVIEKTDTEEKPAPKTEPEPKEMSAADKLLARLNKKKQESPKPASNPNSLIDKFLKEEPHLDRNKEVKEGDMGEESIKQPELYSEKLAKLYIQQGHFDQAIESYKKLNLKYPEKSAYFAAKIEEISKLKNNNQ